MGLRQGCPLSPILFSLYIGNLEKQLPETGLGFRVPTEGDFWNVKQRKYFCIPGLLFADDLLLVTNDWPEMEKLLEVTSNLGNKRSIKSHPQKSGVIVFSKPHQNHFPDRRLEIHGLDIPMVQTYKYLGMDLSAENDYLSRHWEKLTKKANEAT